MLNRHELTAFCVAPATAPVLAALLLRGTSRFEIAAVAAVGSAWGLGLGVAAGLTLWGLLRVRTSPLPGA